MNIVTTDYWTMPLPESGEGSVDSPCLCNTQCNATISTYSAHKLQSYTHLFKDISNVLVHGRNFKRNIESYLCTYDLETAPLSPETC